MIDISVIIPVYNQVEQLMVTLGFFARQTYAPDRFEIIVVNDGSTDMTADKLNSVFLSRLPYRLTMVNQENQGRAAARNAGAARAEGQYLVFCDADRFPATDFLKFYMDNAVSLSGFSIVGRPMEYYGKIHGADDCGADMERIHRFSRESQYYKKIKKLFDEQGLTQSPIAWAAYLVGNSCISSENFRRVGGFDPIFTDWGFEHFDFALRLLKKGLYIKSCPAICNYHIPHGRPEGFYKAMIEKSTDILNFKYPEYDFTPFKDFLLDEIDLQSLEQLFTDSAKVI